MRYISVYFRSFWVVLLFGVLSSSLYANGVDDGKHWLSSEVNSGVLVEEHNISSHTLALSFQSAKEITSVFSLLDDIAMLDTQMLLAPFIQVKDENTTEYLSSYITTHRLMGNDVSTKVDTLLSLQNSDGGFGHSESHQSTALDTAVVLETLFVSNANVTHVTKAIDYLLLKQSSNGSWQDNEGDNLYITTLALRALWLHRKSHNVQVQIDLAKSHLLSQKNIDGSYTDETYLSALILRSIAPLEYDKTNLQTTIDYLKNAQQTTGSWEEDIYTTALVLQALVMADKEVPNPDLATLSGLVVDGDSGIGLSNIAVELEGISTVSTSSDGRFEFAGLQNDSYTLHITSDNHAPLHTIVRMVGNDINLGTLRLNKNVDATISTLQGVIKDQQSGEVLSGVTVSIGDSTTVTDSSGSYTIDSIEAGSYTLALQKSGYIQKQQSINIPANTLLYYNATLNTIDFTAEATIQGTIVDKNTSTPLEGVLIELIDTTTKSITTTNDGRFIFSKVGQGQYDIKITKEGYRTQVANVQIDESKVIDFGIVALDVADPADTTVLMRGTITEAQTNIPLQGALISVGTSTTYSDSSGNYELTDLDTGIINIEVSKDGYNAISAQSNPVAGSIISFSPSLQKVDANLSIYGTIFDTNSSALLAGVQVTYSGEENITVYTDEQGYYLITPVTKGNAELSYSKLDYESVSFSVEVNSNSLNISPTLTLLIKDKPDNNAIISGIVMDSTNNDPLSGVTIHITGAFTDETIESDTDGRFRIEGIRSYDVNISFIQDGYKSIETSAWLQRDESLDMGQVRMRPLSADILLPDLSVGDINVSDIHIEQNELLLDGNISLIVTNKGKIATESSFSVLAYFDVNRDGNYSELVDNILGESNINQILDIDGNVTISIEVNGELPYVNAPISLWIDSGTEIIEIDEENNRVVSSDRCTVKASIQTGQFNPVVKFEWDWKNATYSSSNQVMSAPMVGQINDDNGDGQINNKDIPDIVFTTFQSSRYQYNGVLRAISGEDGKEILAIPGISPYHAPALGDIDNDGLLEIIVGINAYGGLKVFENDGILKWSINTSGSGEPALADLNNDGMVEIIYGGDVYDSLGNRLWGYERSIIPVIVDINNDDTLEVISNGKAYDSNGNILWDSGYRGYYSAVGNFDKDKYPEIAMVYSSGYRTNNIILLEHDGTLKWGPVNVPGGGGGAITISDVDADGEVEIGIAGAHYYVVYETDGSIKWQSETKDYSSRITGSTVFDFEGDGKSEILYNDEAYFRIYNGENGEVLFDMNNTSGTLWEYPIVADIDNDGHAEIILATNNYAFREPDRPGGVTGIRVLEDENDSWMPTRSIWNQHSYHISNINDDGTIPRVEEPSWLTHNTYRLNTFADRDPRATTDLSVSLLKLIETTDTNLTLFVRVGNGGSDKLRSSTKIAFYDGDPTNTGTFIGDKEITALDQGDYIDIMLDNISIPINGRIYAVVDPENKISECDETNNRMDIPATASTLAGNISVSTDSPSYTVNQVALLSATSTNLGKLETNLIAQLILEDTNGNVVQSFNPVDLGIVASQESKIISSEWNTTTTLAGTYILKGILTDTNGNMVDESTISFNIIGEDIDGVSATLDVTTDRLRYHTTDTVLISNFIESLSSNSIITDARVELQITDSNGSIVNTQTLTQGDLLPLSTKEANTNYGYTRLAVGNYTIHAELYGNGDTLYASDTTLFKVYEDLTQALKGTVSVAWYTELAGADQTCDYSVTNFGSTALHGLPVELRLMDLNSSTVVQIFTNSVDINTTSTVEDTETFSTNGYEAGDYSCALYAQTGSVWTLLEHQLFTVEVPPIIIEATIEQQGKGRLLILLDPCENNETNISCEEPFGSVDAVDLTLQRSYLENLLTSNGYSYTIVTDAESFTTELRSGAYTTYTLLDETVKLSKELQNELREAVFKGEGLLVSGTHDSRNHFVYETLGVEYRGHHSKVESVEVNGEGYSYFEAALLDKTHAINFDADGTERLANYLPEGKKATLPSAVKYTFGQGESIFAGFDLLAEASTNPQSSYGNFLLEALADIYQEDGAFVAGDIIPMTLEVVNEGIATPIRTDINISNNAQVVDAIGAEYITAQRLSFKEELLAEDETKSYYFWLQALSNNTNIELIAKVFSLLEGNEVEQAQLSYSVTIGSMEDMESILAGAEQVILNSKQDQQRFKQVIKELEQAQSYKEVGDLSKTLSQLIKATDILQELEEKESIKALRVMIDQQIRSTEIQMNKAGE